MTLAEMVQSAMLVLGGGVGVEVVRSIRQGLAARRATAGRAEGEREALIAARQYWMENAYRLRLKLIAASIEPPELSMDDPYTQWREKTRTAPEEDN